jgi:S-sulfosulfanyl-L-cysteine sulfohydrolase
MSFSRREFMQVLAVASAGGMALNHKDVLAGKPGAGQAMYDLPKFGNVSFLHFTDCHAQLMPIYFREPNVNLGVADALGRPPHIVGEGLLKHFKIRPGTPEAHAFTYLNFEQAAKTYGKVGGFAHMATLIKQMRASRPYAMLLDGGDTWQGSATALWTNGQDMVDACKLLGVNAMSPHWEFTLGEKRVKEIIDKDFAGNLDFLAQNVKTNDFGDPVFKPYVIKEMNGVPVAVIGQAFPYTPIANPGYMVSNWTFGIQDDNMQKMVDEVRAKGAQAVVVISHNGMDVDIKMASRVTGIDAILGGHTHDGMLDFDVRGGKVQDFRYKLLPVFANLLPADTEMQSYIDKVRAPYKAKLDEKLAVSEGLLYRRGNFNGSWDQLIVDALMEVKGADMAFSPGFRWGTTILPGQAITRELMMDQVAITYPSSTLNEMTGETIKTVLEDVCDNLFNPDPYYQQGGDMVRVGGLAYTCDPKAGAGKRISNMMLKGKPIEAGKTYKVAGWAPVAEGATGEPIWDVMEAYFKNHKTIAPRKLNAPKLVGMEGNPGMAA